MATFCPATVKLPDLRWRLILDYFISWFLNDQKEMLLQISNTNLFILKQSDSKLKEFSATYSDMEILGQKLEQMAAT
ncbi:MAG: hypothetical protein A2W85_02070 [Bacteroidetes bacterium GWF2_41_31]|nr:MAG: hypothetical protein A2W85_02070 [Bacteroidetes bacterium GWF2_41_31]